MPMRALIVHSLEDIASGCRALRAMNLSETVNAIVATPPDAACYYGVGVMKLMQEKAAELQMPILIGAGSNAAIAISLMQAGVRQLYVDVDEIVLAKLQSLAEQHGVRLFEDYPSDAVDMRAKGWEEQINKK